MDQLLSQLPTTPLGWGITIAGVGIVLFSTFSKIRANDMDILRNANDDLRKSIEDNEKKRVVMEQEISVLKDKVTLLERTNKTMEDLVVIALKQYFFENPKMAEAIQKSILTPKLDN